MTAKLKAIFAAAFFSLGCATLTACVPQPADTAASDVDEAIGIPGADPYAFYVFNRQNVAAEQQPEPMPEALPPVVCVCYDEVPGSMVRQEADTTAELRPR